MPETVLIGDRAIGSGEPCFVIAEIGLNHNGDPELARQLIDVAADAGADAVKFQRRDVDELAVGEVLHAVDDRFPSFGSTYYEIRRHLEFGDAQFRALADHARARGLVFLCTPFDIASLEALTPLEMPAYKLASASVTNLPLIERMAEHGRPVVLSTGMCSWSELDRAVGTLRERDCPLLLLHCVSAYPSPPELANLRAIDSLTARYGCPVGYSSHDLEPQAMLAAVARGAALIERHITLDRGMEGFDHRLSSDPAELVGLVRGIRLVERMLGDGDKRVRDAEWVARRKYHVSLVTRRALAAGELIAADAITVRNPGTGLPPSQLPYVLGRRAARPIPADRCLDPDDIEAPAGMPTIGPSVRQWM